VSEVAAPVRPAYREGGYLRYVVGQAVSQLGDSVWGVALAWVAVRVASPGVAGAVLAVSAVPRLALLLFGGPLADRYDARRLMVGSDALRAVVTLVAAAVALRQTSIGLLVAVALVFGMVDAVFLPAAGSVRPRLLRPEQYAGGAALYELSGRAALTLGAPFGGLLVAYGGLSLGCVVDAATFVVSMAALWTVRPRPVAEARAGEPYPVALRRGLGYLVRHRVLRVALSAALLVNLGFVGPMNVGIALLSHDRGWGAAGIGMLLAGFGTGAAVVAVILLRVRVRRGLGPAVAAGCVLQGGSVVLLGVAPTLPAAVAAAVLAGLTSGLMGILMTTVVQASTDDAFRGRVTSVSTLSSLGVTPLAIAGFGALAGVFGTAPVFTGSAVLSFAAGALCLGSTAFRRVDLKLA
jgi:predicted MFS family arabinose efflux permease